MADNYEVGGWALAGVKTSVEEGRRFAFAATNGDEGVVKPVDLEVMTLATPLDGIRVRLGSALILSRYAEGETYQASLLDTATLSVTPAPSDRGRSDLVALYVADPWARNSAWPEPADPETYNGYRLEIFEDVGPGVTRLQDVPGLDSKYRTGIALARIDLPAGRGDVQQEMIKDLRQVANPRSRRRSVTLYPTGAPSEGRPMPTSGYSSWPLESSERPQVDIPIWATRIIIRCDMAGIVFTPGAGGITVAGLRTGFASTPPGQNTIIIEDAASTANRENYFVVGTHVIPEALRGTTQYINVQGVRSSGVGSWRADYQTSVVIEWEFQGDL
jgi:hypothetical protein